MVYEDVGDAVVEVLGRLGIEVIIPRNQVCCSAPMFLNGAVREALPNITRNLDILDLPDADAIVVDCATCAAALKKGIPDLLEDLGQDTEKARRVAAKVRDVSQIVAERVEELDLEDSPPGEILSVTYHDPCHMVRGLGVTAEPRKILRSLPGTRFVEMEGAAECCGGGGTYQFEHVELSAGITSAKKANIRASGAEVVATGCPGCRVTLTGNLSDDSDPQVTHTVQILAGRLKKM
jgi:glycolate oxidase iron-sulfur subunit